MLRWGKRERRQTAHQLDPTRAVDGNTVTLLVDGIEAYPAMLEAIATAQRNIQLTSYIFAADKAGERFRDGLAAATRRGVRVRVLVDGVGSLSTPDEFFTPITEAGGEVAVFRRPTPWRPPWKYWRRDHRKIMVVDDAVGFIGGMNIGNDYAPASWGGGDWHDAHARVVGPVTRELARIVNRTWYRLTGQDWTAKMVTPERAGSVAVQVLENRFRARSEIRRAYLSAIRRARESICIANAYFIPDLRVRGALIRAARHGVKVQLLLAGQTDIKAVQYASRAMYHGFVKNGVEIYEWTEHVLHAKTAVIDGRWCSIGSFNMDHRSVLHNLEANIVFVDNDLGGRMLSAFRRDLPRAQQVDLDSWHRRHWLDKLLEKVFYQLRMFL
jgi:cardiolipin synthase A/B